MGLMGLFCAVLVLVGVVIVDGQSDNCAGNSQVFIGLNASSIPFSVSSLQCSSVWASYNYILRYAQNDTNTWSFLLSATNRNSWVGMGFSQSGAMVGSSAIVGWVDNSGSGTIKQYYLGGQTPSQVQPDQGALTILNNYTSLIVQGSTLYLAFQLQFTTPLTSRNMLYAIGPQSVLPSNNILSQHDDKIATVFDFSTGTSSISTSTDNLRKNHGIVNILGWGTVLPLGVIVARYFKRWDPVWFYLHGGIQLCGFILGIVGIIMGFKLYDELSSDVNAHRAIGIVILTLGVLQVLALFLRPTKDSKKRKYWNWYHHWAGRILLGFVVVNIFYGIYLGGAGQKWNIGYGFDIGFLVVSTIVLELSMFSTRFRKPAENPPTAPVYDNNYL